MQRPRLDHVEVGEECPELGLMLDATHQVLKNWVTLGHHRRPGFGGVVDQYVDAVLTEGTLALLPR